MNIVVLVKEVPDTSAQVTIAGDGKSIEADGLELVINPYDEYAIEEALTIQAEKGGEVVLLTAGPDSAQKTIRKGLAMGAERAVLVDDPAVAAADGLGVAKILAKAIEGMGADLVLCGREAVDHGESTVPGALAEYLGWPHATDVVDVTAEDSKVVVLAERDGGQAKVELDLPAVLTAQKGLNKPRYASLKGIMKAKRKKIEKKTLADLGLSADDVAAKVQIQALEVPAIAAKSLKMIDGDTPEAKAKEMVRILTQELKLV